MSRIIAIVNQKGGVGKTSTAVNIAAALAAAEKKVLLVDMDPQGNASTGFGIDQKSRQVTTYDVIIRQTPLSRAIRTPLAPYLHMVTANQELSGAEVELVNLPGREYRLKEAMREQEDAFDVILLDCPPSLGLLTVNALVAAQSVLIPLQCEFYAMEGLSTLMRTVEITRRKLNPGLAIEGIVLTMHDGRNNLSEQVAGEVRSFFGAKVYQTMIPRNVRVSEAPSFGKPVLWYDIRSRGAQAYMALTTEMLQQWNKE